MSKWVKFSDRHPTVANADSYGSVVILRDGNQFGHVYLEMNEVEIKCGDYDDYHWLENVPPFPRTLEDVVRDYLTTTGDMNTVFGPAGNIKALTERVLELQKEMREILEKGLDNQDS